MPRPHLLTIAWTGLFVLFLIHTASVYVQGSGGAAMTSDDRIRAGLSVWQQRNCQGCHQLYGLGGYMGPDLTNTFGRWGPDYIEHFIRNGGARMPAYPLPDDQIDALIAFLAWVDTSGQSQVPAAAVHWSGTYVIERD